MDKQELEKLNKIMNVVKKDFVSSTDVKSFLTAIITFAKDNRENLENLSQKYLNELESNIAYIEALNAKQANTLKDEKDAMVSHFDSNLTLVKDLIKKVKKIKGKDGKDADEDLIVDKVLEKIVLPEYKETVLDTGEQIVDKINALSLDEENKIDASHIKNLPEAKGGRFYGGSGTIKEIVAGDNVTVDNSNLGYPVISSSGISETLAIAYAVAL